VWLGPLAIVCVRKGPLVDGEKITYFGAREPLSSVVFVVYFGGGREGDFLV